MSDPLVVIDADVLGRRRTGDESYVHGLLQALPAVGDGLRFAAVTRRPDLVPPGIEPIELSSRVQELRMAVRMPMLLRRLRPALAHFVHSLPLVLACPAVLTVQDLSFERDASLMGYRESWIFRLVVPRSARHARRVLAISQRTKDDLVALYALPPEKIVVTPLAPDPAFRPGGTRGDYLLLSGAIEARKNPLLAADAAAAVGRRLVVVGPERDAALVAELRRRGVDVRGYVPKDELVRLYQEAAALLFPTRHEGFGLPVVEAMACGTPVVSTHDPAVREVGGDAITYAEPGEFAAALVRVLADPESWGQAGLERARLFSWERTARATVAVYREALT
ncbi:MAG TPA: glycosyltransferase family 1 protein [Gaiellaceae bacterium]|jgi:glycosyltransferase involved in cell wall biosynthesis|nr:glycosyltransferase family 1 protein [Gaiellaceae bacterium]